ncbi:MAG TPA: cytochrome b5-like heme/steroid binding domain-containing protein [Candidatus Paceibacterota bacterium]|nr:cytochrome b5-like heme/steroid binding domain-containing protein [Candidatus Paceibacterota bacterium]
MKPRILLGAALILLTVVFGIAFYQYANPTTPTTVPTSNPTPVQGTSTPASVATSSSSTPTTGTKSYTLAQVATHNSASSCWSAINGNVYDLTNWINQHPGGPEHILAICGIDGSSAFNAQHGGQARPAAELKNFYIGTLAQ